MPGVSLFNCPMYECCVCTRHTGTVYMSIKQEIGNLKKVVQIFCTMIVFTNWGHHEYCNNERLLTFIKLTTLEFPTHNADFHLLTMSVNVKCYYKINMMSPKAVNIINSHPKAFFFKWPSKIYKGHPKDGWTAVWPTPWSRLKSCVFDYLTGMPCVVE